MNKKKINAEIIADSVNKNGNRITTFVLTYPRIIHAELLTHRLFSRNAASSRAIPSLKMIKDIEEDPFIPVAWQKSHSGMQGTEYFESNEDIEDCEDIWIYGFRNALEAARIMNSNGITKQLVNRILEPYQWYTCIVTATEYDNFFNLRCPQYEYSTGDNFKSIKDAAQHYSDEASRCRDMGLEEMAEELREMSDLEKLKINKGQGEIHISLLAEAMWDARNESKPKQLKAGEWHIPFGDKMDKIKLNKQMERLAEGKIDVLMSMTGSGYQDTLKVKIATARCARVSYLNFEGKDDYEADIKLYDRLLEMGHMSPFEHCARAMNEYEYSGNVMGNIDKAYLELKEEGTEYNESIKGWSGNFRGFVQLRKEIE